MKLSQKTMAILLSLTMISATALPAFAVEETTAASTSSASAASTTASTTKSTSVYASVATAVDDEEETAEEAAPVEEILSSYDNPNGRVLSVAYTGNSRSYPEDSLQAIKSAMNKGVDIVSVSVQKTADDQLVLMEDSSLSRMLVNRTTGETASGKVSDYTLQQLQEGFYLRSGHGGENNTATKDVVATLGDAIDLSSENLMIYVTNGWSYAEDVNKVAREKEATDTVIIGGATSADSVTSFIKKIGSPICHIGALYVDGSNESSPKSFAEDVLAAGADLVMLQSADESSNIFKESTFKKAKESGRIMISMTKTNLCGNYRDMIVDWEAIINMGYDVLETDYPEELANYIADVEVYRTDLTSLITQGQKLNTLNYSKSSQNALEKILEEATTVSSTGAVTLTTIDETRYNLQETIDALEAGEEIETKHIPTVGIVILIILGVLVLIGLIILGLRFMNKRKKATNKKARDRFKNRYKAQSEANLANAVKAEQQNVAPINVNSTADNIIETIQEDTDFEEIKVRPNVEEEVPASPVSEEAEVTQTTPELFIGDVDESEQRVVDTTKKRNRSSAFLKDKKKK